MSGICAPLFLNDCCIELVSYLKITDLVGNVLRGNLHAEGTLQDLWSRALPVISLYSWKKLKENINFRFFLKLVMNFTFIVFHCHMN